MQRAKHSRLICFIPLLYVFLWCNNINAMASNYLYKREFVKKQKEKGLCIECSTPVNGSIRCDNCNSRRAEYRKNKYQEWKKSGLCCQCGNQKIVGKTICETHYLKQVSYDRLGTSKYWKDLKELIVKQDFKCALTGDAILFGDGIELDHIIPKNKGGKDELLNVQWVTKQANGFKSDRTQSELFELCNKIVTTIKNKG